MSVEHAAKPINPGSFSRRSFLRGFTATAVEASLHAPLTRQIASTAATIGAIEAALPVVEIAYQPSYENHPLVTKKAVYKAAEMDRRQQIAYGDSLAWGFVEGDPNRHSPNGYIVRTVNETFGTHWAYGNSAGNGSTAAETVAQMQYAIVDKQVPPGVPTDLIISAGANNIRQAFMNTRLGEDLQYAIQNPTTLRAGIAAVTSAHQIAHTLNSFQTDFSQILLSVRQLQASGASIENVFFYGVPPIGRTKEITFSQPDGKDVTFSFEGNELAKGLADNICHWINRTMIETIEQTPPPEHVNFYFVDHNNLQSEDFHQTHPTIAGYEHMGRNHLQRCFMQLPDGTSISLLSPQAA